MNNKKLTIEEANKEYAKAIKNEDIKNVMSLLDAYPKIDIMQHTRIIDSLAATLCENNSQEIIKYLLEEKKRDDLFYYKTNSKEGLNFALWKIGEFNHVELLKYVIQYYKDKVLLSTIKDALKLCLRGASTKGHIEIIDYILLSKDLPVHPTLGETNYYAFQLACDGGHLELMKYYLFNKELKNRPKVTTYKNHAIRGASWNNHLDSVIYLLTSEELETHADIHAAGEVPLAAAIRNENIAMLDFLLKSPMLKEKGNIHYKKDLLFRNAVKKNKMEAVQYLICDYQIEKSPDIEKAINKRKDIQKMFEMRGLYKKLTENFPKKESNIKKIKI